MALESNANNEWMSYTGNLGDVGGANWSMCGWARIVTANGFDGLAGGCNNGNGRWLGLTQNNASNALAIGDQTGETAFAVVPGSGEWFYFALTAPPAAGGTARGYWSKGPCSPVYTQTRTSGVEGSVQFDRTALFIALTTDTTNNLKGQLAYLKFWHQVVLTPSEVEAEMRQWMPVREAGIWAVYPLIDMALRSVDYGPKSRSLTTTGTLHEVPGPDVPMFAFCDDAGLFLAAAGVSGAHYYGMSQGLHV